MGRVLHSFLALVFTASAAAAADTASINLAVRVPLTCEAKIVADKHKMRRTPLLSAHCNAPHRVRIHIRDKKLKHQKVWVRLGDASAPVVDGAADFTFAARGANSRRINVFYKKKKLRVSPREIRVEIFPL